MDMLLPHRRVAKVCVSSLMISTLFSLSGCGASIRHTDEHLYNRGSIHSVRVFGRDECIRVPPTEYEKSTQTSGGKETGFLVGLTSALAPSIISKMLDVANRGIEKHGREFSATSSAATSLVLADSVVRSCLVFVAGSFGSEVLTVPDGDWTADQLNKLGLAKQPEIYAEFLLHSVDGDGKFAALSPLFLEYKQSQAKNGTRDARKSLSFVIELAIPENTQVNNLAASAGLGLGLGQPPASVPAGTSAPPKPQEMSTEQQRPTKDTAAPFSALATYLVTLGNIRVPSVLRMRALSGLRTPMQLLERSNRHLNITMSAIEHDPDGDPWLEAASFLRDNKKTVVDSSVTWLQRLLAGDAVPEAK